jgi:hypothetical protein
MTREERDQKQAERLKKEIEERSKKLAEVEAKIEENDRAKRDKKRYQVGTLADTYGLFHWDLPALAGLFQILARLKDTPDPLAVLESLLADRTPSALPPAAAGPCCLPSAAASDASDVSKGGGGVCSPETWGTK